MDLRPIELDVTSQLSVDAAIDRIIDEQGHLDVIVHNAGHMVRGRAEAFTPEQYASVYDVNVLGHPARQPRRPALPASPGQRSGRVGRLFQHPGRLPALPGPLLRGQGGHGRHRHQLRGRTVRFGIDTTIIVPGAFTSGTNHFTNAGAPADTVRAAACNTRYGDLQQDPRSRLSALIPPDADADEVAPAIARVVGLPHGKRPFRVHIDPSRDSSEVVSTVADRIRADFHRRIDLPDLLTTAGSR